MKKIMSLMLGLSLLSGIAVFAQEPAPTKSTVKSTKTKSTKSTASKGKKKKATTTAPSGGK